MMLPGQKVWFCDPAHSWVRGTIKAVLDDSVVVIDSAGAERTVTVRLVCSLTLALSRSLENASL